MPFSSNPLLAPVYQTPAGDPHDRRVPVVSLVRSGRPIEEGIRLHHNIDRCGYILGRETEGLGVAPVELQSAPLAGGGSVFRHARLTEGEVFLPITLSAASPSHLPGMFDRLVQLVQPGRGEFYDIVVFDPYGYEARTRSVVFESGLTDPVRVSARVWKTSLTGKYMDPFWYGRERVLSRRLGGVAKKFITAKQGEPDPSNPYITYEWEGTPHASTSVMKRGHRVLARNLISNPSFETNVDGLSTGSGISRFSSSLNQDRAYAGEHSAAVWLEGSSAGGGWVGQSLQGELKPGDWLAFSASIRRSAGPTTFRYYVNWTGTEGEFISDEPHTMFNGTMTELPRVTEAIQIPEGVSGGAVWVRVYDGTEAPGDGLFNTDAWIAVTAPTRDEALALAETYFDGDTPNVPSQIDGYEFSFFPILLGGSTIQQKYELMIQGDAPAYWDALIRGPGRDFTLRNQNGEGIFIAGEIEEPIVIVNRPQQQDITLTDGTPIWERLDTGKGHDDFFMLEPGENVLEITMVGATLESDISFRYREAFYHSIGGA